VGNGKRFTFKSQLARIKLLMMLGHPEVGGLDVPEEVHHDVLRVIEPEEGRGQNGAGGVEGGEKVGEFDPPGGHWGEGEMTAEGLAGGLEMVVRLIGLGLAVGDGHPALLAGLEGGGVLEETGVCEEGEFIVVMTAGAGGGGGIDENAVGAEGAGLGDVVEIGVNGSDDVAGDAGKEVGGGALNAGVIGDGHLAGGGEMRSILAVKGDVEGNGGAVGIGGVLGELEVGDCEVGFKAILADEENAGAIGLADEGSWFGFRGCGASGRRRGNDDGWSAAHALEESGEAFFARGRFEDGGWGVLQGKETLAEVLVEQAFHLVLAARALAADAVRGLECGVGGRAGLGEDFLEIVLGDAGAGANVGSLEIGALFHAGDIFSSAGAAASMILWRAWDQK